MKKRILVLILGPLSINAIFGQTQPVFCPELIAKAKVALEIKDYDNARTFCESALPLCPQSSDSLQALLKRIAKAIDAETLSAIFEKKRAEKATSAAENAAVFTEIKETNPTLAARMMLYNAWRHPNSKLTHNAYYRLITDTQAVFISKILRGHQEAIADIAFSPDGKKVLTGSYDNTAKLWDFEHQTLEKTFFGHISAVNSVAFSPDGTKILTGSSDFTAKLWNINNQSVEKIFVGHLGDVNSVAFSADGKKILTGSVDNTAKLWDIEQQLVEKNFIGHTNVVTAVAFSPDNKKILTGSADSTAKLWDIEQRSIEKTYIGHTSGITCIAFSMDGKKILTGSNDNTANLWDIDLQSVEKTFAGHSAGVFAVAFSPDGKKIVTSSVDNTAKLWNIKRQSVEKTFVGHRYGGIGAVAFSPDGKKILTGGSDRQLMLWNINPQQAEKTIGGAADKLFILAIAPDGNKFLTIDSIYKIHLWVTTPQMTKQAFLVRDIDPLSKFSSVTTPQMTKQAFLGNYDDIHSPVFSPDGGSLLFFRGNSDTIKRWNIEHQRLDSFFLQVPQSVFTLSPDGKKMATTTDGLINLWNIEHKKLEKSVVVAASYYTRSGRIYNLSMRLTFTPDSKTILFAIGDTIKAWDTAQGSVETVFVQPLYPQMYVFSPDCTELITSHSEGYAIKLWDLQRNILLKTFVGHKSEINSLKFSPDGKKILSGSIDKTVKLWNIEQGILERTFVGHQLPIKAIAFAENGKKILSSSDDSTIKLWDVETEGVEGQMLPYSIKEMAGNGLQWDVEDSTEAKIDMVDSEKIESQNNQAYYAQLDIWQASDAYQTQVILTDSLRKEVEILRIAELKKNDPFGYLDYQIVIEKDTLIMFKLRNIMIDSLENRLKKDTSIRAEVATAYGNQSWYGIFAATPKEIERIARRGVALDSTQIFIKGNLGHALLLQGQYENALTMYKAYLYDERGEKNHGSFEALLKDLEDLDAAHRIPKAYRADFEKMKAWVNEK